MRRTRLPQILVFCFLLCFLVSGCIITANAASRVPKKEALKLAKKYVPSKYKLTESEWDQKDSGWEFEFMTCKKDVEYEVLVDGQTGTVKEVEKKRKHFCKATRYAVSGKDAGKKVKRSFKNVEIVKVKKKTEDGCKMYIVSFNTPEFRGRAKIHGVTGKIIQWEKRFLQLL